MITSIRTDPRISRGQRGYVASCTGPGKACTGASDSKDWMQCAALKQKSLQPEVTGIAAESCSYTCLSLRGRKQATHRCYDSSTTDFLVRHHLLLPNLLFFSRSMRYQLLWAEQYLEHYQTSFPAQQEFLLPPTPGGKATLNLLPRPGRVPGVWWLQGTGLGSAGRNSWRQHQAEMPLLSVQRSHTHTPAAHPRHLQRPGTTIMLYPEWYFYSDKFCRGRQA